MNMAIFDGVLRVQLEKEEEIIKELLAMNDALKGNYLFTELVKGSMAALVLTRFSPTGVAATVIHAMHVGMAYAKAEREVAELEGIK